MSDLISGNRFSRTAIAETHSLLCSVSELEFRDVVMRNPLVAQQVMLALCRLLSETEERTSLLEDAVV